MTKFRIFYCFLPEEVGQRELEKEKGGEMREKEKQKQTKTKERSGDGRGRNKKWGALLAVDCKACTERERQPE